LKYGFIKENFSFGIETYLYEHVLTFPKNAPYFLNDLHINFDNTYKLPRGLDFQEKPPTLQKEHSTEILSYIPSLGARNSTLPDPSQPISTNPAQYPDIEFCRSLPHPLCWWEAANPDVCVVYFLDRMGRDGWGFLVFKRTAAD
jgi:hypothetical protein